MSPRRSGEPVRVLDEKSRRRGGNGDVSVFERGNLNGLEKDGWSVGHFISGPRRAKDVAVKWMTHDRGTLHRKRWASCRFATTLAVLISGGFEVRFKCVPGAAGVRHVILKKPGDYVLFGPGIPHKSESLADGTVFLTIRWPSRANDTLTFATEPTPADCRRAAQDRRRNRAKRNS